MTTEHPLGASDATMEIRPMLPGEAAEVGELTLASYDLYGAIQGEYRGYLADPLQRLGECTELLVAVRGDRVVGTVSYVLPGDAAWEGRPTPEGDCGFRVLAVAPDAEGRGVGRRLVEACIARSQQRRLHRVVITSMSWMSRAHRLYGGLGFVRRPDLDVRFPGGTGVVFTLDLTPEAAERFPAPGDVPPEPPWFRDVWTS